ncbi:MAG: hypothetical protein ABIJ09_14265 [Pseudomonadota bacterium]
MGSRLGLRSRRTRDAEPHCPLCREPAPMLWRCRCGFFMCQTCMDENAWGLSCNGITWTCPDCGESNSYGNQ